MPTEIGFKLYNSYGTYFLCADPRPLGYDDSAAFCSALLEKAGMDAISNVGILRSGSRAHLKTSRRVESPGALYLLQTRRHSRLGNQATLRA